MTPALSPALTPQVAMLAKICSHTKRAALLYDTHEDREHAYLAFEYGEFSLAQLLKSWGEVGAQLPPASERLTFVAGAAAALADAHAAKIAHRDLHAGNVRHVPDPPPFSVCARRRVLARPARTRPRCC